MLRSHSPRVIRANMFIVGLPPAIIYLVSLCDCPRKRGGQGFVRHTHLFAKLEFAEKSADPGGSALAVTGYGMRLWVGLRR